MAYILRAAGLVGWVVASVIGMRLLHAADTGHVTPAMKKENREPWLSLPARLADRYTHILTRRFDRGVERRST
jgi:hypothetical protein